MKYIVWEIKETEDRTVKTAVKEFGDLMTAEIFLAAMPNQLRGEKLFKIEMEEE